MKYLQERSYDGNKIKIKVILKVSGFAEDRVRKVGVHKK
jgi:hypothetical protein